jgi:hypothetical protein
LAVYYTNELSLELPTGLKDKTHHIFALTDEGPSAFNIVIARNPVTQEETPESYGDRMVTELARALPDYRLMERAQILVDHEPALRLRYRWLNQGVWMNQTQVSVFHTVSPELRQVIQITATTTNDRSAEWDRVFDDVIASTRLRKMNASSSNGFGTR